MPFHIWLLSEGLVGCISYCCSRRTWREVVVVAIVVVLLLMLMLMLCFDWSRNEPGLFISAVIAIKKRWEGESLMMVKRLSGTDCLFQTNLLPKAHSVILAPKYIHIPRYDPFTHLQPITPAFVTCKSPPSAPTSPPKTHLGIPDVKSDWIGAMNSMAIPTAVPTVIPTSNAARITAP